MKEKFGAFSKGNAFTKGRPSRLVLLAVGLVLIVLLAGLLFVRPQEKAALPPMGDQLRNASQGLDEITITATFSPDQRQLYATQRMTLQNRSGLLLQDVVLRTYANAFASQDYSPAAIEEFFDSCYPNGFSAGGIAFSKVLVDGNEAAYAFEDEAKTVLHLSLSKTWQPGDTLEIDLTYVLTIPECAYRFGYASGIYTIGNAFPTLAVMRDGQWRAEEYFPLGDPFTTECANYHVTVTTPEGYQCAGSAYPAVTRENSLQTFTFEAPAVRDFALSISNRFTVAAQQTGNVLVSSYGLSTQGAQEALKYAVQALQCFEEQYGPYPYQHFAVSVVDFPFGGMEYPSLVLLQSSLYGKGQELEWVAAHETAHQWWYATVGSDQYFQPWQDEALAEYSLLNYVEKYYGERAWGDMAFQRIETAMRVTIPQGVTPGSPIDYFGSLSEYSLVVYRRGAALMLALETAMGDTFQDFLRVYYEKFAFKLASRSDFEETLQAVSGQDWSALTVDYLDTYIEN